MSSFAVCPEERVYIERYRIIAKQQRMQRSLLDFLPQRRPYHDPRRSAFRGDISEKRPTKLSPSKAQRQLLRGNKVEVRRKKKVFCTEDVQLRRIQSLLFTALHREDADRDKLPHIASMTAAGSTGGKSDSGPGSVGATQRLPMTIRSVYDPNEERLSTGRDLSPQRRKVHLRVPRTVRISPNEEDKERLTAWESGDEERLRESFDNK